MAKFLTSSAVTLFLELLIKEARERVVFVSPYLQTNPRIRRYLEGADLRGLKMVFIYGKTELHSEEREWLFSLKNASIRYCESLHAKCYINERSAIVTSMNLYSFSQQNNDEMGVHLDHWADRECFRDAWEEVNRLLRVSKIQKDFAVEHACQDVNVLPEIPHAISSVVQKKATSNTPHRVEKSVIKKASTDVDRLCYASQVSDPVLLAKCAEFCLRSQPEDALYLDERKRFKRAYMKWSEEELQLLVELISANLSNEEISKLLQRQSSSIRSRAQKVDGAPSPLNN